MVLFLAISSDIVSFIPLIISLSALRVKSLIFTAGLRVHPTVSLYARLQGTVKCIPVRENYSFSGLSSWFMYRQVEDIYYRTSQPIIFSPMGKLLSFYCVWLDILLFSFVFFFCFFFFPGLSCKLQFLLFLSLFLLLLF